MTVNYIVYAAITKAEFNQSGQYTAFFSVFFFYCNYAKDLTAHCVVGRDVHQLILITLFVKRSL